MAKNYVLNYTIHMIIPGEVVSPMFKAYYSLAFNPFDKQHLKEKNFFESKGHKEMMNRLKCL